MAQKRIKRTDQEWFELIKDCKSSSLKVKTWCEQHGITAKAPQSVHPMVLHLDFHGVHMEISNDAAQETITKTLLALQNLC